VHEKYSFCFTGKETLVKLYFPSQLVGKEEVACLIGKVFEGLLQVANERGASGWKVHLPSLLL